MNWQAGPAALTASAEQRTVNLARDSARPMETSFRKRLGMDLHLGDYWPLLRLAYAQRQPTQGGAGLPNLSRQEIDSLEAAIEYQFRRLAVHAGSQYDTPDFFQGISRQHHRVSGTFSPLTGLTVEPEFSLTEKQDSMTNQRAEIPAAQLGFAYQLRDRSTVHLRTAYSRTQRGLGSDQNTISTSSQWNWPIQSLALTSTSVSLQTVYRSQTDPVHASHATDDFAATVHVNLTGVSWGDMLFDRGWSRGETARGIAQTQSGRSATHP